MNDDIFLNALTAWISRIEICGLYDLQTVYLTGGLDSIYK